MRKLAIIVGHNKKQPGAEAVSPLNTSEFAFNNAVADIMVEIAAEYDIEARKFQREYVGPYHVNGRSTGNYQREIDTVYGEVNAWNPVLSTELHFNSYTFTARGSEVLSSGTDGSLRFAQETQLELVRLFNRRRLEDRGIKIRKQNQRGGSSLFAGIAPAILVEPFFGSSRQECQMVAAVGKETLARAYLKAAQRY